MKKENKESNIVTICPECFSDVTKEMEIEGYEGIFECAECGHPIS